MHCPNCESTELEEGWLELRKTILSFALFGFGAYHLYFEDRGGRSRLVLRARRRMPSYQCRSCGTLVAGPPGER